MLLQTAFSRPGFCSIPNKNVRVERLRVSPLGLCLKKNKKRQQRFMENCLQESPSFLLELAQPLSVEPFEFARLLANSFADHVRNDLLDSYTITSD